MLTFILIGGLVWFVVALVLVLALAAAARKQVSPVAPTSPMEEATPHSPERAVSSTNEHSIRVEQPIAT
jgi:hypothetical protein